jgi:hypothetical protein
LNYLFKRIPLWIYQDYNAEFKDIFGIFLDTKYYFGPLPTQIITLQSQSVTPFPRKLAFYFWAAIGRIVNSLKVPSTQFFYLMRWFPQMLECNNNRWRRVVILFRATREGLLKGLKRSQSLGINIKYK